MVDDRSTVDAFHAAALEAGATEWQTTAAHSGVWPEMHANTSRAITAFSDFPAAAAHPLHPAAEQLARRLL